MSRRNQLADLDPLNRKPDDGNDDEKAKNQPLSMTDADSALFGELAKREANRQTITPLSIFSIQPDVQQPRRAVPFQVRGGWSGEPRDIADLFNTWLNFIAQERHTTSQPPFDLDEYLWAEAVASRERDDLPEHQPGPVERAFLKVVELAVSIRRDGLANPVSIHRLNRDSYKLETGERRWLAYHILFGYFNGDGGKPDERSKWEKIPAIIVEQFNVWRQASENTARADLNAIGRARQYAILMIDLLSRRGVNFKGYDALVQADSSDRPYYAQVIPHRVPNGTAEQLANGLGVSHRAAFTRSRSLLGLPDEVWIIGDNFDFSEDELLRLAKLEPPSKAIEEARRMASIVATRNNLSSTQRQAEPDAKAGNRDTASPALFKDAAVKRGKRLFPKQNEQIARELMTLRSGVGQARPQTKQQIKSHIQEMRFWLDQLESAMDEPE